MDAGTPESSGVLTELARHLYETDREQEALKIIEKISNESHSEEAQSIYATILLKQGNTDLLLNFCERWIERSPGSFQPHSLMIQGLAADQRLNFATIRVQTRITPPVENGLIPRHIIQFWDKPEPPEEIANLITNWASLCRSHTLLNERTARNFLSSNFNHDTVKCFDYCHHPAMKADFIRLAYLALNGGIYIDADDESRGGLDALLDLARHKRLILVTGGYPSTHFNNLFIASAPNHPVIERALRLAIDDIKTAIEEQRRLNIWGTTGPGVLTKAFSQVCLAQSGKRAEFLNEVLVINSRAHEAHVARSVPASYKATVLGNWRLS